MCRSLSLLLICGLGLPLAGCGGDDDPAGSPDSGRQSRADDGVDAGEIADAMPMPDMAPAVDAEVVDAGEADMGRRRSVDNCQDACEVLDGCGALEGVGGSVEACLEGCALAETAPRFQGWLACVELEACEGLAQCPLPEPPPPPCAEVCAAAEACDEDFRLPTGLPGGFESCEAACAERVVEIAISECGGDLVRLGVCDEVAFARCVLAERSEDCLEACEVEAGCVEGVDVVDCALACAAGLEAEDPVTQLRAEQRLMCLSAVGANCEALDVCAAGRRPVDEMAVAEICAADEACGIFGEGCAEQLAEALPGLSADAPGCLRAAVGEGCETDLFGCFRPSEAPDGGCASHCQVSELCGLLPEGQDAFACQTACQNTLAEGGPEAVAAYQALFQCAGGSSCGEVSACQEAAQVGATCAAHCGRRAECEALGDFEDVAACEADCADRFLTDRHRAERACVAAVDACEAVAQCTPPAPPPCDLVCGPLDACELTDARCALSCDNADFDDPNAFLPRLACVTSTERCDARQVCEEGDLSGGLPCLRWCQATVTCRDPEAGPEALVDCLSSCGGGIEGTEGLTFAASEACMGALGEGGIAPTCEALQACIDGADNRTTCAPFCAELSRCQVPIQVEECEAECAVAVANENDAALVACTLGAVRREAGCRATVECIGFEVPQATPACATLCEAQAACDPELDAFLCERECDPEPAGTPIQAACATRAECEDIGLCLVENPMIDPGCVGACAEVGACPGLIGEGEGALFSSDQTCAEACAGATLLSNPDFPASLSACTRRVRAEGACDPLEMQACFDNPDTICADAWVAARTCGLDQTLALLAGIANEAAFVDRCEANIARNEAAGRMAAQCFIDSLADAGGDPFLCSLVGVACVLGF